MVDFAKVAQRMKDKTARLKRGEYHTIIAGSRGMRGQIALDLVTLAAKRSGFNIIKVIGGKAKGIDDAGESWARDHKIEFEGMPADWEADGRGAGYLRNVRMAMKADALIAVWDGKSKGTKHMIKTAEDHGLKVFVLEVRPWGITYLAKEAGIVAIVQSIVVTDVDGLILAGPHGMIGLDITDLSLIDVEAL